MKRWVVICTAGIAVLSWPVFLACGTSDEDPATPTPVVTLTGAHAELNGLVNRMESQTFYVVYEVIGTSGEPERRVIYNDPPRTRVDTIPAGQSDAVSALIGTEEDDPVISCENGPANWECFEIEDLGQTVLRTAAPVTFFPPGVLESYDVTAIDGRNIAGQQARCFEIDPPDEATIQYCFTDQGVLLYSSPTFGTVRAVEFSTDIPVDAFDPPAVPQ